MMSDCLNLLMAVSSSLTAEEKKKKAARSLKKAGKDED
jgi:hypothetical protein